MRVKLLLVVCLFAILVQFSSARPRPNKKSEKSDKNDIKKKPQTVMESEEDDFFDDVVEKSNTKSNNLSRNSPNMYMDSFDNSLESNEIPTKSRMHEPQHDYHAAQRPIYNLLLGILDTFQLSAKHDLRRAQQQERMKHFF